MTLFHVSIHHTVPLHSDPLSHSQVSEFPLLSVDVLEVLPSFLDTDVNEGNKFCLDLLSKTPEVQVQVLGLQNMYGQPRGPYVNRAVGGPEPRQRWIWSGQDVVNTELDLWLRFPLLAGIWDEVVLLGARPGPVRVQRAEGGVGFRAPSRRHVLIAL